MEFLAGRLDVQNIQILFEAVVSLQTLNIALRVFIPNHIVVRNISLIHRCKALVPALIS